MKKSLLIMMNTMTIGGCEKALLNFLHALDRERFDITVLLVRKEGGYLNHIPKWVKVEELEVSPLEKDRFDYGTKAAIKRSAKHNNFVEIVKFILIGIKRRVLLQIRRNKEDKYKELYEFLPRYDRHFDIALDFFGQQSVSTYYISEKVSADIKATWLHNSEFDNIVQNYNFCYKKYNKVYGVSKACVETFVDILPGYYDKCEVFYNILFSDELYEKAEKGNGFNDEFNGTRILSIGRLAIQKGFDIAVRVAAKLKEEGYFFKWYIIGDGTERKWLEILIQVYNVEDCLILLGTIDNPYPFLRECNIYVQPSRFEGYCIALAEARIFNKPIVVTNFFGAKEQITDGETGFITNFNEKEIYQAIKKLFTEPLLRKKFEENLSKETNESAKEIQKFYALIDGNVIEHKEVITL